MNGAALLTSRERRGWRLRIVLVLWSLGLLGLAWLIGVASDTLTVERQLLTALAALLMGGPVMAAAFRSLRHPDLHGVVDQLVALAVIACWVSADFVTATLLPVVMMVGRVLEDRSLLGSREAVEALSNLTTAVARRVATGGRVESIDVARLRPDDIVEVRAGDKVPADGVVVDGMASLDTASLTGESLPVEATVGQTVLGGSVSLNGVLLVRVTRIGEDSALGRVVALMQEAERSKPAVTRLLERYAGKYLLLVILLAAMVWFTTLNSAAVLALLVAACPSAMVLAAPSTALAAVSVAARHGILLKSSIFLERLADADALVVDKTGTVTTGQLRVVGVRCEAGVESRHLSAVARALGRVSSHPVGRALAHLAGDDEVVLADVHEQAGFGMAAVTTQGPVLLGREELFTAHGVTFNPAPAHAGPVAGVSEGARFLGWVLLADEVRPGVAETLEAMRGLGIDRQALLTGDRAGEARRVAALVGLDEVVSGALPHDKMAFVRKMVDAGQRPIVVGDGINDALALRAGAVGIAMGGQGSDIAIASADVVLTGHDFSRVATCVRLGRRARRTLQLNLALSAVWTVVLIALALASGGRSGGALTAAVLQNCAAFVVLASAGRLLKFDERGR
ncbi:cation-translocating P-type ATPase [Luteibacter sp. dw_328]|uniref:heavy metal translocating P-type ATPase n=1 Tax=Luteibacter sp. dw_328 TaxID=2719796 RepID=UPI001BD6A711